MHAVTLLLCACLTVLGAAETTGGVPLSFRITSPSFPSEGAIPGRFTCQGVDVSPALSWTGAPPGTQSFALIVDDPDAPDPRAPRTVWVHWVLYDIPVLAAGLPEAATNATLPTGAREGNNDWKQPGYRGPCPPVGRHRYYFKLYALDTGMGDLHAPTKQTLERAMTGHILAETQLMGTYEKQ